MAVTGAAMLAAPPTVVASDIRTPYTHYTFAPANHATDEMADSAALETAIRDLAAEVKKLREEKPKKTVGEQVATWGPAVAVIAVMVTMLGVNSRVGDLEKKVDQGFKELSTAVHSLDLRLTKAEIIPPAPTGSNPAPR